MEGLKKRKVSIQSGKAKGRIGQQDIVKILLKTFTELTEDDLRSCPMGSQGEDILMSTAARRVLPWNIEVKRGKAFNLVKALKQADFRSKLLLCPSLDCNKGVDERNLNHPDPEGSAGSDWLPACERCNGTGYIKYESVAIGRYDNDKTWYATVELNYLLKLIERLS